MLQTIRWAERRMQHWLAVAVVFSTTNTRGRIDLATNKLTDSLDYSTMTVSQLRLCTRHGHARFVRASR